MATGTAVEVVMPQMGVSVSEGTVTKWLKGRGDSVAADEPLLEISTDKVDTEVPCPADGVLGEILVQEGETVDVGTLLATILPPGSTPAEISDQPPPPIVQEPAAVAPSTETPAPIPEVPAAAEPEVVRAGSDATLAGIPAEEITPVPIAAGPDGVGEGRAFVSPVVARIAAEHGVDLTQVPGTGQGGRVTKKDILRWLETRGRRPEEAAAPPAAAPQPPPPPPVAPPPPPLQAPPKRETEAQVSAGAPAPGETVEPMSVMRRAIAEHMIRSVHTSAHVTTVFEVDMAHVVAIRGRLKAEYERTHGVRLTYLAFICRAVVDALQKWPRMNAELRNDQIVTKSFVNLGIAVALDDGKGLIVPVIRNAEEKNLLGIARAVADLAERARTKKLLPDEVQGGTFTITNPGGFGAIAGTPIINQPQVGVLDVEAIVKRPMVISDELGNDMIAIRPMMNLCLTYDHRLVDGAYAAPFMRDLKANLESWGEDAY